MENYFNRSNDIFFSEDEEELSFKVIQKPPSSMIENKSQYNGQDQSNVEIDIFLKQDLPKSTFEAKKTEHEKLADFKNFESNIHFKDESSPSVPLENSSAEENTKKKKKRISDQNICKRYHSIANRCLRKLKIYQKMSVFTSKSHKRNYFIILMIVAKKENRLSEFMALYSEEIKKVEDNCLKLMEKKCPRSKEYEKNKNLVYWIKNSMKSMEMFERGGIKESLYQLYDLENMKRSKLADEAYKEIEEINKNFQQM